MTADDLMDSVADFFTNGFWNFKPCGTALQCDKTAEGFKWYLAYMDDGREPYYWLPIEDDAQSIIDTIAHLDEKSWVNIADVMVALMPAIRSIRG